MSRQPPGLPTAARAPEEVRRADHHLRAVTLARGSSEHTDKDLNGALETELWLSVASLGPGVHHAVEQRGEVFP